MAATANTTIQLAVPDGLRGRVMSVYTTIFAGSTPIGGPVMGGIASLFGVADLAGDRRRACRRRRRRRVRLDPPRAVSTACPLPARRPRRACRLRPLASRACGVRGRSPTERPPALTGPAVSPRRPRRRARRSARRTRTRSTARAGRCRRGPSRSSPGSSAAISGSGSTRLTDAGAQPSRIARAQIAASMAPDAPSGWPYSAFVPLTGTVARALAERQRDRPRLGDVADRRRRGVGVDVVDLVGVDAGVVEGDRRRARRLAAVGPRLDHVVRVGRRAVAEQLGVRDRAARARRPRPSSSTSSAAPSPMTKPSRPRVERPGGRAPGRRCARPTGPG